MWSMCSHTLETLTKITPTKVKFKWTKIEQDAFDEIKWIVGRNNLFPCPDLKEEFEIHTDDSYFQLGAFIRQKFKTIAFYSRKLTEDQKRYKLTWRELLSTFDTLEYFITILLVQILRIYINHKNLTCKDFKTDIVLIPRLILEEYAP